MMDIVQQHGDLSGTMKAWMDKSDEKGWPKTDVGWHRWLVKKLEVGDFVKFRAAASGKGDRQEQPGGDTTRAQGWPLPRAAG